MLPYSAPLDLLTLGLVRAFIAGAYVLCVGTALLLLGAAGLWLFGFASGDRGVV